MKRKIAEITNDFGFDLLRRLSDNAKPGDSTIISAPSISLALFMLLSGAKGDTAEEIAGSIGFDLAELDEKSAALKQLLAELASSDEAAKLEIATALFCKLQHTLNPDFIKTNVECFGAEVSALDFVGDQEGSLETINAWCKEKTHGKIEKILDQISPSAVMFLLTAVYFRGVWSFPFEKEATESSDFHLDSGEVVQVPTMQGDFSRLTYLENDLFQLASLPYGDGRFAMDVILPNASLNLDSVIELLDDRSWTKFLQDARIMDGVIKLPKFKIKYGAVLNEVLNALGINLAFLPAADFGGIALERIYVSEVRHETYLEVNEEYTEAAAVTSVGFESFCLSMEPTFLLDANRPFLVTIRDTQTGTILFIGAITEPK